MRRRLKVRNATLTRGDYLITVNYVKKTGHIIDATLHHTDGHIIAETDDPAVIHQWLVVA